MNVPNRLTVARMIIAPVFLLVYMLDSLPFNSVIALAIFIIASITDAVDGHLARKNNQVTVFGKLADPVADKMLTTAALLAFMDSNICSVWIVMIILTREFAVTSCRLVASAQGIVIAANIFGKIKTVSQMVFSVVIMLFVILLDASVLPESFPLATVSNVLLGITCVLAVISGIIYIKETAKKINIDV